MAGADSAEDLDNPAWRAQRLDEALAQLRDARARQDIAACQAIGPRVQAVLERDWSRRSSLVWQTLPSCVFLEGGLWRSRPPSAEEVHAAWAPALAHFAHMPQALRLAGNAEVDILLGYWTVLADHGHHAASTAQRLGTVRGWFERAAAQPQDAVALSYLVQLGRALYGQRWHAAWMEELQFRLERQLGPGHEATLHMMRARIFAFRQFEQPAQAVALSDDYALRAALYQPDNERLAMLNRSERTGALAGVGRYADAVDEGRLLLEWLQRQQPRPHGNIMRAAYNLSAAAADMGDLDAAVSFAQLAREQGLLSDNAADRDESHFADLLLQHARSLRDDEGAGLDLKRSVDRLFSWDLPGIDPLIELWHSASRRGDADTARRTRELIDRVVRSASVPLQAARALPRVLDSKVWPAGSAPGLQAASEALALGLAQPLPQGHIQPAFELARHVGGVQPEGAIWLCKRAMNALLQMRRGLPGKVPGLPLAWQREHDADLRDCIGRLIDAGRLIEAEVAIRVLREEELHEFSRRSRGPRVDRGAGVDLAWTDEEHRRNVDLSALEGRLRGEAAAARERAQAQIDRIRRMGGDDAQADAALAQGAGQLRELALAPATRQAGPARRVPNGQRLPSGQARLTYWLGLAQAELWVQVGKRRHRVPLPQGPLALNRAVQSLRAGIARPNESLPGQSRWLFDALIAPALPWLAGVEQLRLVPDGALRYLPFAALHDGRRYLAERFALTVELGAAPAAPARGVALPTVPPRLAAFGRSRPDAMHAALPGVQAELQALQRLRGVQVSQAQDEAFTRAALRSALLARPQVVHLASHFVLDAAGEEASYLLLGDGERMPLRELRKLPWAGVRLAMLSACESGVALPGQGREWTGFADALHSAGVPNVVATLWRIDDARTADLMRLFYGALRPGWPVLNAQSLAQAQRRWLVRHRGSSLAHPYYWAAFQWMTDRH